MKRFTETENRIRLLKLDFKLSSYFSSRPCVLAGLWGLCLKRNWGILLTASNHRHQPGPMYQEMQAWYREMMLNLVPGKWCLTLMCQREHIMWNAVFSLEHIGMLCWKREQGSVGSTHTHASSEAKCDSNKVQMGTPKSYYWIPWHKVEISIN